MGIRKITEGMTGAEASNIIYDGHVNAMAPAYVAGVYTGPSLVTFNSIEFLLNSGQTASAAETPTTSAKWVPIRQRGTPVWFDIGRAWPANFVFRYDAILWAATGAGGGAPVEGANWAKVSADIDLDVEGGAASFESVQNLYDAFPTDPTKFDLVGELGIGVQWGQYLENYFYFKYATDISGPLTKFRVVASNPYEVNNRIIIRVIEVTGENTYNLLHTYEPFWVPPNGGVTKVMEFIVDDDFEVPAGAYLAMAWLYPAGPSTFNGGSARVIISANQFQYTATVMPVQYYIGDPAALAPDVLTASAASETFQPKAEPRLVTKTYGSGMMLQSGRPMSLEATYAYGSKLWRTTEDKEVLKRVKINAANAGTIRVLLSEEVEPTVYRYYKTYEFAVIAGLHTYEIDDDFEIPRGAILQVAQTSINVLQFAEYIYADCFYANNYASGTAGSAKTDYEMIVQFTTEKRDSGAKLGTAVLYGDSISSTAYPQYGLQLAKVTGGSAIQAGYPGAGTRALADAARMGGAFEADPELIVIQTGGNDAGTAGTVGSFNGSVTGEPTVTPPDIAAPIPSDARYIQSVYYIAATMKNRYYDFVARAGIVSGDSEAVKNAKIDAVKKVHIILLTPFPKQRNNYPNANDTAAMGRLTAAVLEVAALLDLPVINTSKLGIDMSKEPFWVEPTTMINRGIYTFDGLHPNRYGHAKIVREIARYLVIDPNGKTFI